MRRARLILLSFATLIVGRAAHAQVELSGDAGLSHLRQTGIPESDAFVVGATLDAANDRAFFHATALGAQAGSAGSTGQAVALLAIADPSIRLLRWEVDGVATAFGETNALPTNSAELTGRLRVGSDPFGAALGAALGSTRHLGVASPLSRLLADGWLTVGPERFGIDLSSTHTRATTLIDGVPFPLSRNVSYGDASLTWRHQGSTFSLGATGGARGLASGPVSGGGWFTADATLWVAHHTGIVLSAGQTLEDAVRGFPRASYASLSVRLSSRPHVAVMDRREARGPRIVARRTSADSAAIEIVAPDASSVELLADFTNWTPVALTRTGRVAGAVWRIERAVPPGAHRLAIRLDGGAWTVPPNLPSVTDDLGGTVGVITIP